MEIKATECDRGRLRQYYPDQHLHFTPNGTVDGLKGGIWSLLLTATQWQDVLKKWRDERRDERPQPLKWIYTCWFTDKKGIRHRWGSFLWREAFGNPTRLPRTTSETFVLIKPDGHDVFVELILAPVNRHNVRKHRVFVKCICGKIVPAGRVHQHVCGV